MSLVITVDDDRLIRELRNVERGLDRYVEEAAEELEDVVRTEASPYSTRLAAPWSIEGSGDTERRVVAPEFFAHFLAGGTAPHGPASASRLVFEADGGTVFALFVSGTPATHFDERAMDETRSRLDDVLRRVIEEAT